VEEGNTRTHGRALILADSRAQLRLRLDFVASET